MICFAFAEIFYLYMGTNYKSDLANNTIWNTIENYSMIGIQLLCTFILARFLSPADFGIIGMLAVFTTIAQTVIDSGFAQAIIREKDINNKDYSTIFYFNAGIAIIIYILLYFSAPFIAIFYNLPQLIDICRVLFLVVLFNSLCIIQTAKLRRELRFKKLCIISICASVISSIAAIIAASYLKNVWAIVIQMTLSYFLRSMLLFIIAKWHPDFFFSWEILHKYFQFSKNLLLSGLVGNIFNNIYAILIGRFYTATELGYFSQADRLRNVSSHTSTSVIQNVTYSIFSKMNNESSNLLNAYKKVISISLIYVGGIVTLLMCVAEDLFQLVMGSEIWRISGRYLFYLGTAGILFPLHSINQNILLVKGKSRDILYLEIARRSIMLLILFITIHYNISIFILGYSLYSVLLLFLNLYFCGKPINYTLGQQLKDIFPILLRFVFIICTSLLTNHMLRDFTISFRFIITSFLCIFIGLILFLRNQYFMELLSCMKSLIHKKANIKNV